MNEVEVAVRTRPQEEMKTEGAVDCELAQGSHAVVSNSEEEEVTMMSTDSKSEVSSRGKLVKNYITDDCIPPEISDGDDITAYIQPLPPAPPHLYRNSDTSTRVGAHAVISRPTSHGNNNNNIINSSSSNNNFSASTPNVDDEELGTPHLIEAQLVGQGSDDEEGDARAVVVAEEVDRATMAPKWVIFLSIAAALIIILLVVVVVLQLTNGEDSQDGLQEVAPNGSYTSPTPMDEVYDTPPEDTNTSTPAPFQCFQSTEELKDAVDAFLANDTLQNRVYGTTMGSWCVSDLQDFALVFRTTRRRSDRYADASAELDERSRGFSTDLSGWDMSNAKDLEETFRGIKNMSLAWGIHRWDVTSASSLRATFMDTLWTEQPDLSSWDVSNVRDLHQLFRWSNVQQANISNWNISGVVELGHLAERARDYNEDLSGWDTSSVTSLIKTFMDASSFNQDISTWNTESLSTMSNAFRNTLAFDQSIGVWDVSNLQRMTRTFQSATAFNQDLSAWNVSSVTSLVSAFQGASSFNQDLCAWGALLPAHANTTGMFQGTACPETRDPNITEGGPFCYPCK